MQAEQHSDRSLRSPAAGGNCSSPVHVLFDCSDGAETNDSSVTSLHPKFKNAEGTGSKAGAELQQQNATESTSQRAIEGLKAGMSASELKQPTAQHGGAAHLHSVQQQMAEMEAVLKTQGAELAKLRQEKTALQSLQQMQMKELAQLQQEKRAWAGLEVLQQQQAQEIELMRDDKPVADAAHQRLLDEIQLRKHEKAEWEAQQAVLTAQQLGIQEEADALQEWKIEAERLMQQHRARIDELMRDKDESSTKAQQMQQNHSSELKAVQERQTEAEAAMMRQADEIQALLNAKAESDVLNQQQAVELAEPILKAAALESGGSGGACHANTVAVDVMAQLEKLKMENSKGEQTQQAQAAQIEQLLVVVAEQAAQLEGNTSNNTVKPSPASNSSRQRQPTVQSRHTVRRRSSRDSQSRERGQPIVPEIQMPVSGMGGALAAPCTRRASAALCEVVG